MGKGVRGSEQTCMAWRGRGPQANDQGRDRWTKAPPGQWGREGLQQGRVMVGSKCEKIPGQGWGEAQAAIEEIHRTGPARRLG